MQKINNSFKNVVSKKINLNSNPMKKRLFISIVILLLTFAPIQTIAQIWQWANSAGGNLADYGYIVTTDASGNVIVTGKFSSPSITFGLTTLTNAGGIDVFIVKYDASGNVLWAKSEGGVSDDSGYSVVADTNGNVIVTGFFESPTITFGTTTLTNVGYTDIFIVKYDSSGNALWAKSAGGIYNDYGHSVVTDINGNVIVTGTYSSPSITFETDTFTNAGYSDIFIAKYDTSGNLLWAKSEGGTNGESGNSIATDANGNMIVTGYFSSSSLIFGSTVLTSAGNSDIFIVKYDASGNAQWAKSAGGIYNESSNCVTTDDNGNLIVTGSFGSSTITFGTTTLVNAGYLDYFIVKCDSLGNTLWASSTGGDNIETGQSVTTDAYGNIIVSGHYDTPSITFGTITLTNAGYADIFIVKYDASGIVLWAYNVGGNDTESVRSITTDINSNIIVTGNYTNSINFGTTTLTNAGNGDIFIAKLDALTGINALNNEENFSVYPNPSDGNYSIELNSEKNETITISLFDLNGKLMDSINWNVVSGTNTIHPSWNSLAAGIYLVKILGETGEMNVKLVVE